MKLSVTFVTLLLVSNNFAKSYSINKNNLKEFCKISQEDLIFQIETGKKVEHSLSAIEKIDWSSHSGNWLREKYEENYKSFLAKPNWINRSIKIDK